MFEKLMIQMRSNNNDVRVEDFGGSKGADSSEAKLKSVVATGNKSFNTTCHNGFPLDLENQKNTMESPPIFLYGCDRSPGAYVLKLGTEIPN